MGGSATDTIKTSDMVRRWRLEHSRPPGDVSWLVKATLEPAHPQSCLYSPNGMVELSL